ncbi:hypothetical protein FACS1894217_15650 [Clostridia bacterium]|nr:hypothetical protein FACS1894217_15650 [Clostridia bacterium]
MVTVEQVEKLLQYADVSYEEARDALEQTNGNMLDAIVALERKGRINSSGKRVSDEGAVIVLPATEQKKSEQTQPKSAQANDFFDKLFKMMFIVTGTTDKSLFSMPAFVLVLLLIFAWPIVIPLLIVGYICGMRYNFEGPHMASVNKVADDVNAAAAKARRRVEREINRPAPEQDDDNNGNDGGPYRI